MAIPHRNARDFDMNKESLWPNIHRCLRNSIKNNWVRKERHINEKADNDIDLNAHFIYFVSIRFNPAVAQTVMTVQKSIETWP